MENFTQARFEDYNLGRVSQKVLRTTLPVRSPGTGNNVLRQRGGHHLHIIVSVYNPDISIILAPYKIKTSKEVPMVKNLPANAGDTGVQSLGQEGPLE